MQGTPENLLKGAEGAKRSECAESLRQKDGAQFLLQGVLYALRLCRFSSERFFRFFFVA